ncbi:MAG: hypothetical protein IIY78_07090 [Clostridia bacterium]|nr:hypothetical protein [Clostridia bacterium]
MSNRKVCFFGHSDAPWSIQPKLREVILDLIDNEEADEFYVGTHGNFDRMVLAVLSELSETRAFRFYVVLAYLPAEKENPRADHAILPDGIENIPPRFAINYRNQFTIETADIVVTYVEHSWGGAAKYKLLAEKKNRRVIEISA